MKPRTKLLASVSFGIALIALLILSAGLTGLPLEAGTPLPGAAGGQAGAPPRAIATRLAARSLPLFEVLMAAALLILLASVPARLIKLAGVRRLFWLTVSLALLTGLALILPRIPSGRPPALPPESAVLPGAAPTPFVAPPLGAPPSLLIWLSAIGILTGVAVLLAYVWRQSSQPRNAREALSEQATRALHDLADGADFPDTIIRCYLQMIALLRRERKIVRESSMTAHEFRGWLAVQGIPAGPVDQLTLLFEKARYGREQLNAEDERLGLQSLNQIIQHCGKGASVKQ